jgi:hypothetical protein
MIDHNFQIRSSAWLDFHQTVDITKQSSENMVWKSGSNFYRLMQHQDIGIATQIKSNVNKKGKSII